MAALSWFLGPLNVQENKVKLIIATTCPGELASFIYIAHQAKENYGERVQALEQGGRAGFDHTEEARA